MGAWTQHNSIQIQNHSLESTFSQRRGYPAVSKIFNRLAFSGLLQMRVADLCAEGQRFFLNCNMD